MSKSARQHARSVVNVVQTRALPFVFPSWLIRVLVASSSVDGGARFCVKSKRCCRRISSSWRNQHIRGKSENPPDDYRSASCSGDPAFSCLMVGAGTSGLKRRSSAYSARGNLREIIRWPRAGDAWLLYTLRGLQAIPLTWCFLSNTVTLRFEAVPRGRRTYLLVKRCPPLRMKPISSARGGRRGKAGPWKGVPSVLAAAKSCRLPPWVRSSSSLTAAAGATLALYSMTHRDYRTKRVVFIS